MTKSTRFYLIYGVVALAVLVFTLRFYWGYKECLSIVGCEKKALMYALFIGEKPGAIDLQELLKKQQQEMDSKFVRFTIKPPDGGAQPKKDETPKKVSDKK